MAGLGGSGGSLRHLSYILATVIIPNCTFYGTFRRHLMHLLIWSRKNYLNPRLVSPKSMASIGRPNSSNMSDLVRGSRRGGGGGEILPYIDSSAEMPR